VLNVAMLLRRHAAVQDALAAAMGAGASVGACVGIIERELAGNSEDFLGAEEAAASASFVSPGSTNAEGSTQEA
jgi:hypothetical protein